MYRDWNSLSDDIAGPLKNFRAAAPETAATFSKFVGTASKAGTPEHAEQELIAMALSVAARCDGCIAIHAKSLLNDGVDRERVVRALEMAVVFGGGPSFTYAALALEAYDQMAEEMKNAKASAA